MYRALAAQPDLFCAYYEPMIGQDTAIAPDKARTALKQIYLRSTSALRNCIGYFR